MLLGCIGDDFTGSSDIANTLSKGGMKVTQYISAPDNDAESDVEAGVIALKSRTTSIEQAVEESLSAADWLLRQGCEQIFFKYCSTFDSTKEGNIGPVADALSRLLKEDMVVFCPAFPATGRSVFQGNLFVNDLPLHESGMKNHPLTPMTDSDLRRWLQHQTQTRVKHLPFELVASGPQAIRNHLNVNGPGYFIADAVTNDNLIELGKALSDRKLITGGSGLAMGLPDNFITQGKINKVQPAWRGADGPGVILSGSCSTATREQIEVYSKRFPAMELKAHDIMEGVILADDVIAWVLDHIHTPLVYTSADPEIVQIIQRQFGSEEVANKIETFFGTVADKLTARGVKRIIVAGGETSGAVVTALGIQSMEIGPEIAPGVPALRTSHRDLVLTLKSGNFGGESFFEEADKVLSQ